VLSSAASCLWKSFRRSRTPFRDRPETVRFHPGSGVHPHPGILFDITVRNHTEIAFTFAMIGFTAQRRAASRCLSGSTRKISAKLSVLFLNKNIKRKAAHRSSSVLHCYAKSQARPLSIWRVSSTR
jgi:hypothetical protein